MITQVETLNKTSLSNLPFTSTKITDTRRKILIIDNDSHYANQLKYYLEKNNFEVITSNSGNNGIYSIIVQKPDIVISEINLPDINGLTVLKELNKFNKHFDVKFIFMSDFSISLLVREAMDLGALDFLQKPLEADKLLRIISETLPGSDLFSKQEWDNMLSTDKRLIDNCEIENFTPNIEIVDPKVNNDDNDPKKDEEKNNPFLNYLSSERNNLNDYEKFKFNDLTLIIINLTVANQNEAISFRNFLFPIIAENPAKILIDLSQIEFIDSAFTGVFVEAAKRFRMYNKTEMRLVMDNNRSTINPFILDWVKRNFKIYDNLNFAVNCFNEITAKKERVS